MANFFQLLSRSWKQSLENPKNPISSVLHLLGGVRTESGATVSMESAIKLVSVYACTKIIAESLASLQIEVLKKEANGNVVPAVDHPVYKLFKRGPSPFYSTHTFVETSAVHLVMNGNATSRIISDVRGDVQELRLLDSRRCSNGPAMVKIGNGVERLIYKFQEAQFAPEEILHIPNMSFDGLWGKGLVEIGAESIGVGLTSLDYAANLLSNGGALSGYLKHPGQISDSSAKRLRSGWNRFMGSKGAGNTPILEEDMSFVPLTMSPTDMRLMELMKFQLEEMARLTRVPLHLVQQLDRSTNNNIEQQSIDFVMHTLRPYCKRFESEWNRKLFTENERDQYFIRFNVDSLLRGDSKSRAEYLSKLYSIGVLSPNDIRKILKLNPIEGGDIYLHQGAMMPINKIMENEQENA